MEGHVLASSNLLEHPSVFFCCNRELQSFHNLNDCVLYMLEVQSLYLDVSFNKLPMRFSLSTLVGKIKVYMWAGKVTTLIQIYSNLHP